MICKHCLMSIEPGKGYWVATEGVGQNLTRCRNDEGGALSQRHEPDEDPATPVAGPPTTSVVAAIQGLTDRALVEMRAQFAKEIQFAQEINGLLYGHEPDSDEVATPVAEVDMHCKHCGVLLRPHMDLRILKNAIYYPADKPKGYGNAEDARCLGTDRRHEPINPPTKDTNP